jgi:hypothetical protein
MQDADAPQPLGFEDGLRACETGTRGAIRSFKQENGRQA